MRRLAILHLATVIAALNAQAAPVAQRAITIDHFAFAPKELTVTPGTRVVWTNHDAVPHAVTARDKRFVSPALDTDDRFEYTFEQTGDFDYFCTLHPFMTGIVHVRK